MSIQTTQETRDLNNAVAELDRQTKGELDRVYDLLELYQRGYELLQAGSRKVGLTKQEFIDLQKLAKAVCTLRESLAKLPVKGN